MKEIIEIFWKKSSVSVVSEYELRMKSQWNHYKDCEQILLEFEENLPKYRKSKRENWCVGVKHSFLFGLINIEKKVYLRASNWKVATIYATMSKKERENSKLYQKYLKDNLD